MSNPPSSTPHSDIDGVHQNERPNVEVASDLGQAAGVLADAKAQATARPKESSNAEMDGEHGRAAGLPDEDNAEG
jgi:hypothetical protein